MKIAEIFHTNVFRGQVNGHIFVVLEHLVSPIVHQPVIGLSLVTACLTTESSLVSYLCHACEELCSHGQILAHLHSADHYINYYTHKDPDELSFSWIPSTDVLAHIRPVVQKEVESNGHGELWVLDLPKHLTAMFKTSTCTYGKVMEALCQIDELARQFKVEKPQRITIQAYQKNPNRMHPLLGLQHLLEYSCPGLSERKAYLCMLCSLSFPARKIIKHILGFDHIYWYFKKWHPGTLLVKDFYKEYTSLFRAVIWDLANQAQALNESAATEIKCIVLEPAMFMSVIHSCSSRAFEMLESVWRQCNRSSLKTQVKPGDKLVPFSCKCEGIPPVMETVPETDKMGSVVQSCSLVCQDCKVIFKNVWHYKRHVRNEEHQKVLNRIFGIEVEADGRQVFIPSLDLYNYLKDEKRTEPVIGESMMVICLSTKEARRTFYLCMACRCKYPAQDLKAHLCSRKHLLRVLMLLCPYKLPFAWEKILNLNVLKSLAWEFERNIVSKERAIKVFDIAQGLFNRVGHMSYTEAMQLLMPFHFFRAERQLKFREFQGKVTFPIMGVQFLVMYSLVKEGMEEPGWGFLCVLCKRKLSEGEYWAHLLTQNHVAAFLNAAHPGSLDIRLSREMFLDLANQAKKFHSAGLKQVVRMANPIQEPVTYETAFKILNAVKKRCRTGCLVPTLPAGKKLVPTGMSETVPHKHPVKGKPESIVERQQEMGKENSDKTVGLTQGTETGQEVLDDHIILINSGRDTETETPKAERMKRGSETGSLNRVVPDKGQEMGRDITGADGKLSEIWTHSASQNMPKKMETNTDDETRKGKETMEEAIKCGVRSMGLESTKNVQNDIGKEIGRETVKGGGKEIEKMKGKTLEDSPKKPEGQLKKATSKCIVTKSLGESYNKQNKMLSIFEKKKTTEKRKLSGIFGEKTNEASKRRRLSAETDKNQKQKVGEAQKCLERQPKEDYSALTPTGFETKTSNLSGIEKGNSLCDTTPSIELWNFLKRKDREAVIGLNALIECNSDVDSPFYLCVICKLLIQETLIVQHVVGDVHRAKFLEMTILGRKRRQTQTRFKFEQLEKEIGCGEAQAIQLDPALHNTLAQSNFAYAITMVNKLVEQQTSDPSSRLTVDYQSLENPVIPATPICHLANTPTSPSAPVTHVTPEPKDCPNPTCASPHLWYYLNATSRTEPVTGGPVTVDTGMQVIIQDATKIPTTTVNNEANSTEVRHLSGRHPVRTYASECPGLTESVRPLNEQRGHEDTQRQKVESSGTLVGVVGSNAVVAEEAGQQSSDSVNGATKTKDVATVNLHTTETPSVIFHSATLTNETRATSKKEVTSKQPVTSSSTLASNTISGRSERLTPACKTVPAEPSMIYKMKRGRRRPPCVVGLNHMVAIACGRRRRYFCKLCGVRLKHSQDHLEAFSHQYNFVRFWRPGWTACPLKLERKLSKIVSGLSKAERNADIAMQKVHVNKVEYRELVSAPLKEAFGQLEVIIKKQAEGELPEVFKTNPEPVVPRVAAPSTNSTLHSPEGASMSSGIAELWCSTDSQSKLHHMPQSPLDQIPTTSPFLPPSLSSTIPSSLPSSPITVTPSMQEKSLLKPNLEVNGIEHMETQFHLSPIPHNLEVKSPKSLEGQNFLEFPDRQLPPSCPAREPVPCAPSSKLSVETVLHTPAGSQCQGHGQFEFGFASSINAREIDVGPSHLSKYLKEKGLHDTEPIMGLMYILECRGISQMTFLCMSCAKTLSITNVCEHIISMDHQIRYMEIKHPNMLLLWKKTNGPDSKKTVILRELFWKISDLEMQEDAQVMLLEQEWCEHVQTASFNKALEYLQSLRRNLNLHPLNFPLHATMQKNSEPQDLSIPVEPSHAPKSTKLTEMEGSRAIDGKLSPIPRETGNGSLAQSEKAQSLPPADKVVQQTPDQSQASKGSQRAQASPPPTCVQNLQIAIKQEVMDPELDLVLQSGFKSVPVNGVSIKPDVVDFDTEVQSCVRVNTTKRKGRP